MSSRCPHNMVNFGLLAAEIDPVVWGTPANFNGFRVLAALLHGSQAVSVSQTLRRWTEPEGATYVRQGDHQVGQIGPHSSLFMSWHSNILINAHLSPDADDWRHARMSPHGNERKFIGFCFRHTSLVTGRTSKAIVWEIILTLPKTSFVAAFRHSYKVVSMIYCFFQ